MQKSWFLLLAFAVGVPLPALAGPPPVLSPADRLQANKRPMAVSITQQLGISVDVGRVMSDAAYGGGLLGALINTSMDNKRQVITSHASDLANATVAPLADALKSEDIAGLALETTRKALSVADGFDPAAIAPVSATDASAKEGLIAAYPSAQIGSINYRCQMSPDFTQLQVIADISIVRSAGMLPLYAQRIVSSVELKQRSYEGVANVARWTAMDAAVAKSAIRAAFRRLEKVVPAVLNLDQNQFATVTDKQKTAQAFGGGYYGPLLLRDESGPVVWSKGNGFIAVQAATD